jgi:penicillin-binding protein 1A
MMRDALLGSPRLPVRRRLARVATFMVLAGLFIPPAVLSVAAATYITLPLPASLPRERPQADSQISNVYAGDGSLMGQFREAEQRVPVPAGQIPDTIKRAVIASEDHSFYRHGGLDVRGTVRAVWADLRSRRASQGGSTITQQLVKNLYTGRERSVIRKVREALIAAQVERVLPKNEIIARYLNTIYLGQSVFGVQAASQSYFRKDARSLSLSEAALLAGIIPAPSFYDPRAHPEAAERRRNVVLDKLLRYHLASADEVASARAQKPRIFPPPGVEGRYPFFLDYVRVYLLQVKHYPPDLLYRGGLKIQTTISPHLQEFGEKVVARTLNRPNDPEASLVSVEPQTGYVRALVGGKDWNASKVNLALGRLGGGSGRQPGSAFKPFVLARALESGISPSKRYSAPTVIQPRGFNKPVHNVEGEGGGSADLRTATWKSINTVFVQLILDAGVQETAQLARRLGITSISADKKYFGGIAIGTQEVSPLDMASAYSVFAARGLRSDPTPILRITDGQGRVIEDNSRPQPHRVLEEVVADNVTDILKGVILHGTGTRANLNRPAAGKTGTSQEYQNAWFAGYTPTLSTAVWVGYPKANISMRSVHGIRVFGGTFPAQMWHDFMQEALKDVPVTDFNQPAPLESQADRIKREQRGGFDTGIRRSPAGLPTESPYYTPPPAPEAHAPETTTTTSRTPVTSPLPP